MATLLLQCVPPMRCSARLSTATSLWVFLHSAYYLITEKNRLLIEIRWLTWVLKDIPFFCPEKLFGWFWSMRWVVIYLHCELLFDQFFNIWLNLSISELIVLFLSAVASSVNTCDVVPLAAIHALAITFPPLQMIWYASDHKVFFCFSHLRFIFYLYQAKIQKKCLNIYRPKCIYVYLATCLYVVCWVMYTQL